MFLTFCLTISALSLHFSNMMKYCFWKLEKCQKFSDLTLSHFWCCCCCARCGEGSWILIFVLFFWCECLFFWQVRGTSWQRPRRPLLWPLKRSRSAFWNPFLSSSRFSHFCADSIYMYVLKLTVECRALFEKGRVVRESLLF